MLASSSQTTPSQGAYPVAAVVEYAGQPKKTDNCTTMAPFRCLARICTNASNSVGVLSRRVDRFFERRRQVIEKEIVQPQIRHSRRYAKKAANASSPKRLRYALRMLKRPPARTWGDTLKSAQVTLLRAGQCLCNLALGEIKQSINDPTDLYDHYALSGHQVLPDHFYNAVNASRANCVVFGEGGMGVLPCESPEQIMKSKTRFGVLQVIYGFFF
ncbi:hypothetical protein M3P05_14980 [Sansalvadorimonas sp. 2012CJ34-2]|uniref:Uncharacterized protein n=1 Tax=Parendozoicomonas callyspongiae TaxID=2942213 RepID=A0ABT0PLA9_9GAMM|nr:hypothetical protein [Sansalvadorimonas sp. 2012CJ34-2]MCL6271228.1 hypothetical protein [Sansalvadorimonas sp. 2012CJ34-2]